MKSLILCYLALSVTIVSAQETRYADDPLLLGAGARALGLGGAYVAISDDATALYWNPAGLAKQTKKEIHAQHTEQFGGSINHDVLALGIPVAQGGIGIGLIRLGVDHISLTRLEDPTRPLGPDNRPILSQTVGTTDNSFYLAYAHHLRGTLSAGIALKLIRKNLEIGSGTGFGLDVGLLYLPKPNMRLGLVLRNLTQTRISFDSGHKDRISPSALLGAAYTHALAQNHHILGSLSVHFSEETSNIDNSQGLHLGIEYQFQKRILLRLGRQDNHLTAGAGLRLRRMAFDFAFLEHSQLDNTYRISASFYF